jgi:hypothetical protein
VRKLGVGQNAVALRFVAGLGNAGAGITVDIATGKLPSVQLLDDRERAVSGDRRAAVQMASSMS